MTTNQPTVLKHYQWIVCLHAFRNHCLPFGNGKINVCDELESAILSHIHVFIYPHTNTHIHTYVYICTHINNPFTCEYVFHLVSHSCSLAQATITITITALCIQCTMDMRCFKWKIHIFGWRWWRGGGSSWKLFFFASLLTRYYLSMFFARMCVPAIRAFSTIGRYICWTKHGWGVRYVIAY